MTGPGEILDLPVESFYMLFKEEIFNGWGQYFSDAVLVAETRSPFQHICVFQTSSHGKILTLDGAVQVTERDEFAYQEMIVHVPMFTHGQARRVLVVGGGDGGALRQILRHPGVERVTIAEIDAEVVRLSRKHMPALAGTAWDDPRLELNITDAIDYVRNHIGEPYDVIIVDSTDPAGVGEVLFTDAFYQSCSSILGKTGIIVNQNGVPFMQSEEFSRGNARRRTAFTFVSNYGVAVPTYVGGFMALGIASNTELRSRLERERISSLAAKAGLLGHTRYWSPEVHAGAFALPPYMTGGNEPVRTDQA